MQRRSQWCHRRGRRGSTLIELLAALSLAGLALLGAQAVLGVLSSTDARVSQRVVAGDEQGIGHRRLRELLSASEAGESSAPPFFGDARGAAFSSRCRAAGGWTTRCRVELQLVARRDSIALELREDDGPWVVGLVRAGHATLIYRDVRDGAIEWRDNWGRSIARPSGLAIVTATDTLAFLGGAR